MIQVRNVPERLHRELLRRAREEDKTLTAYIQEILEREVKTLPWEEIDRRIQSFKPINIGMSAAEVLHEARAERTEDIYKAFLKKEQRRKKKK